MGCVPLSCVSPAGSPVQWGSLLSPGVVPIPGELAVPGLCCVTIPPGIPRFPAALLPSGLREGQGSGISGIRRCDKQKSLPCSPAVAAVLHDLPALTFCCSPAWFHSPGPASSLQGFLLPMSFSFSSPYSITVSGCPCSLLLAELMGMLLLKLVTKGLSQFPHGQADPTHFTCHVPPCLSHIITAPDGFSVF